VKIRLFDNEGVMKKRFDLDNSTTTAQFYDMAATELGVQSNELVLSHDIPGKQAIPRSSTTLRSEGVGMAYSQTGVVHSEKPWEQGVAPVAPVAPPSMDVESTDEGSAKPSRPKTASNSMSKTFRIDDVEDIKEEEGVQAKFIPTLTIFKEAELAAKKARTYGRAKGIYDAMPLEDFDYALHTSANTFRKADGHVRMHARDAPLSVMLTGQKHRHLDNADFRDNGALQQFLGAWQRKGMAEQCMVWLYGKYVPYDAFPDGVRAEVYALYEPPQMGDFEGVNLLPDPTNEHVERVAHMLGLCRVGWATTATGRDFVGLSSSEVAAAARFQQVTRVENSPLSRFATVLLMPSEDGAVEPTLWQVTDQCVALHRDNILQTPEKPDFCKVRVADKSNVEDFVAPVIYKGHESEEIDVAFLQVRGTVTQGGSGMFKRNTFPTRLFLQKDPTMAELKNELRRYEGQLPWPELLSDFNLLVFLAGLPQLKDSMQDICNCVTNDAQLDSAVISQLQGLSGGGGGGGSSAAGMNFADFGGFGGAPAAGGAASSSNGGSGTDELRAQLMAMGCDEDAVNTVIAAGVTDIEGATAILFG